MRTLHISMALAGLLLAVGACAPAQPEKAPAAPSTEQLLGNYLSSWYGMIPGAELQKATTEGTYLASSVTVSAATASGGTSDLSSALTTVVSPTGGTSGLPTAPASGSGTLVTAPASGTGSLPSAPGAGSGSIPSAPSVGSGAGLTTTPSGSGSGSSADLGTAICTYVTGFVSYLGRCSTNAATSTAISNALASIGGCSAFVSSYLTTASVSSVPASVVRALTCIGTSLSTAACGASTSTGLASALSACGLTTTGTTTASAM